MNYQQALAYAEECGQYGCVPGLENMRELLGRLGNPQEELAFVHIAGFERKRLRDEFYFHGFDGGRI